MVETQVEHHLLTHGSTRTAGKIRPRFERRPRGSVRLVGVARQLFEEIYLSRFATYKQLCLALRGAYIPNDRYLHRQLRKLYDHAYISKVPTHAFEPEVYCVSGRATRGRRAAAALFGSDARIVANPSHLTGAELEHALTVTTIRVLARLGAAARGWRADVFDHQELIRRLPGLAQIPDSAILVDKEDNQQPRMFLVEYQSRASATKTTEEKVARYLAHLPDLAFRLGASAAWVLLVLDLPQQAVTQLARKLEGQGITGDFFLGSRERVLSVAPATFWFAPVFCFLGERGDVSLFADKEGGGQ